MDTAEYFLLQVLGPGCVIVAVVVTAQLHPVVKVLLQGGGEQGHRGWVWRDGGQGG